MKTSETQTALIAALFAAKKAFPPIAKNKKGQAGNRAFQYAPLDVINDHVNPVLWANDLMITQGTEGHELVTRLEHLSGEWRETRMPVNAEHANMQSYGIEITYRRRYSVQLILGIVTEEDIDIKEKNRAKGVDNTEDKNANGTKKLEHGAISAPQIIFSELPPEVQDDLRKKASQVDASMPDVQKAINLSDMIIGGWPDVERNLVKSGLWYLLNSKTKSAMKRGV